VSEIFAEIILDYLEPANVAEFWLRKKADETAEDVIENQKKALDKEFAAVIEQNGR
jgi:hypothetical protein